ncbi:lipoyl protein ligase domain-containing protein [Solicola sp. PLA-1-18]|uniref:lipoyl protein ligase domain-containing protein n=1 Tax=Solicola sp. PLA-1-18 TaxID=3380532 RepID=UPI003B796BCE
MPADDPARGLARAHALLRAASAGDVGPTILVHRPPAPAVAFGGSDTRRAGFGDAVRAARAHGFTPVVRAPGGKAVAYTTAALVADVVVPEPRPNARMRARFVAAGEALAEALRGIGVDARHGEVPGEYCPGAHSVNARGTSKLAGTAQRVVRDAWLFSVVLVTDDAAALRPVLADVYAGLGQPFDPASVGAVRDEVPSATDDALEALLTDAVRVLAPDATTVAPVTVDRLAERFLPGHQVGTP